MAQLLQKFSGGAGLDIGTHSVKAVRVTRTPRGWRLTGCACFPRSLPHQPTNAEELAGIASVLHRQGLAGAPFTVAAPFDRLRSGVIELPLRAPGVPLDQIARAEFARVHKCDPQRLELAYWELPAPVRAARTTQVMAAGIPHADSEPWLDGLAAAGLAVRAVDTHASAIARACLPLAQMPSGAAAVIDLGFSAAVLALVKNGVLIYERRISEGGLGKLLENLCRQFQVEPEVGEYILRNTGIRSAGRVVAPAGAPSEPERMSRRFGEAGDLIADYFLPLAHELQLAFAYVQHQYHDTAVGLAVIAGGGAGIPGLCEHLSSAIGIDCRVAAPEAAIECAEDVQELMSPALMPALGLAMFGKQ